MAAWSAKQLCDTVRREPGVPIHQRFNYTHFIWEDEVMAAIQWP